MGRRPAEDGNEGLEEDFPDHPLFPIEDPEDPRPDVSFISLMRFEGGRLKTAARVFSGLELRTLAQIEEMYGGGSYQLWGRKRSKANAEEPGTISVKRGFEIPGPSKPLGNFTNEQTETGALRPVAATPALNDNVLVAVLQMQSQQQAAAAAQAQAQSQQFMTMMAQMMSASKTESSQMMQMMISMGQQSNQSMVQMITAMMANKGGGPEEMGKFLQLAKSLQTDNSEKKDTGELDVGSMLENVADAIAGVNSIMQARAGASGNGAPPVSFEQAPRIG